MKNQNINDKPCLVAKSDYHDCHLKRTRLVWFVDSLCAVLLVGCTIWVACRYGALPDRIPVHYGADGIIDGYGSKSTIWMPIAIMWTVIGFLSAVELFPKHWNTVVKITKENHVRVLSLTWHLLSTTKLVLSCMFAYIVVLCVSGMNLSVLFLPILFTVLGANFLYWIVRLILNR